MMFIILFKFLALLLTPTAFAATCPTGHTVSVCCMGDISPYYTNAQTWGSICGYYPTNTSELVGGRCLRNPNYQTWSAALVDLLRLTVTHLTSEVTFRPACCKTMPDYTYGRTYNIVSLGDYVSVLTWGRRMRAGRRLCSFADHNLSGTSSSHVPTYAGTYS